MFKSFNPVIFYEPQPPELLGKKESSFDFVRCSSENGEDVNCFSFQ